MKRILFIGNANSFLIIQLAKKLMRENPNWEIDILSDQQLNSHETPFSRVFCVNDSHPLATKKIIKAFYVAFSMKRILKNIGKKYDYIHILYVSAAYRFIWQDLKKNSLNIGLTVFGGDFYKASKWMKLLISKMAKEATFVSATNPATLNSFCEYFQVQSEKRKLVRFGLNILDEIDSLTDQEVEAWRIKNGILMDETVLACGYNSSPNQNLLPVINSLKISQKNDSIQKLVLCFQLYEKSKHVEDIIDALKESGFKYIIFSERLTDKELALYRSSVEIMIQVQSSDSFSGAMQEHLYAGSKVITGTWLPYEIIDLMGMDYFKVEKISDVGKTLKEIISAPINQSKNKEIISSLSKWDDTISSWINLYD